MKTSESTQELTFGSALRSIGGNMKTQKETGQVIVILALVLVGLVGFTALAVDGGRIFSEQRSAQSAADTASLSGALAKCQSGNVQNAALTAALQNGFDNDGITNTVAIHNPPTAGQYAGDSQYTEVVITTQVPAAFYQLFHPEPIQATVHAISVCNAEGGSSAISGSYGIIVLNKTKQSAYTSTGNGDTVVSSGGIFVNSNHSKALTVTGNGDVTADVISVVGGYRVTGNGDITPTPTTGVAAISDPLADVEPPPTPSGSCTNVSVSGNNDVTIDPGYYCKITATGNGDLTLNPGVYWIKSGNFAITGNGDLIANNVMIYMGPSAGNFSVTGNGDMTISPPTSGEYKGLALFVDRSNTNKVSITGNGDSTSIGGTYYMPSTDVALTGNGGHTVSNAQFISDTLSVTGNGDIEIDFDPAAVYQPPFTYLISLVE